MPPRTPIASLRTFSLHEPGYGCKSFRDSMFAAGRLVPVPGLADDAFYVSSAGNSAVL